MLLAGLLVLGAASCAGKIDALALVTAGRDGWQQPERVLEGLGIRPGDRVAEIGAGSGYWIEHLSRAVGPEGRVYAVEVETGLAEALRSLARERGLSNVEVVLGGTDDPRLPEDSIDLALTCLTYHHIEDRVAYFERLRSVLRADGRVAHLDDRDDHAPPLRWLPTAGHWSNVDEMDREMEQAGYALLASHDFLLLQAFRVYGPRRKGGR